MTTSDLVKRRMYELTAPARRARHSDACVDTGVGCRACQPDAERDAALSELRRLGALWPVERATVARQIGSRIARVVWPDAPGSEWRAA